MRFSSPFLPLTVLALAGGAGAQSPTLTGLPWTLTGWTEEGRPVPVPSAARPTLRLDDRLAAGSTGCNVYRAPYATRGNVLRFGALATTRRACPLGAAGVERQFLNRIVQVTRYQLSGHTLTLFVGRRDRLVFQAGSAASTPTPEGSMNLSGNWTLTGGTALRPLAGRAPALTFEGERVSGTGGCNRLLGTFRVVGETLTFGPLASTRMACAPEVNAQEAIFLQFLAAPLQVRVEGQTLTLTGESGRTLVFRRAGAEQGSGQPDSDVREGTYTLATVNGKPAPLTPQPVTLSLQGDRVSGNDGCNSFSGAYRLGGTRLILTASLASTLRACPDVPDSVNLPGLLGARPTLTFTGTGLTLQAGGTTLMFTRN